jgi:uncharacterized membrane protein YgcG
MGRLLLLARPFLAAVLVTVAFLIGAARSTAYTPPIVCDANGVVTPATMDYGQTFAANVTYPCTLSDPTYTLACNGNNGTLYFWGMSEVTCQAKDSNGNLLPPAVMFPVSVTLPPPTFQTTPGHLSFPASGPAGGAATWTTPTAVDVGGASVPVTCDHQSGLVYPIGDTLVGCTAQIQRKDSEGHPIGGLPSATTQFTITITAASSGGGGAGGGGAGGGGAGGGTSGGGTGGATSDKTAPTLALHGNIVVAATGPQGALVRFTETATDAGDAPSSVAVDCAPASGSTFALAAHRSTRLTKVTCSAHDAAGNQAVPITFTVTVLGAHSQLAALELRVSGSTRVLASAKTSLVVQLARVDRDTHLGRAAAAQAQLGAFISSVARLKGLSRSTRASWEAAAARLITIVG